MKNHKRRIESLTERYSSNFATEADYHRHYRSVNKERLAKKHQVWKAANPDIVAKLNREATLRRYKITQERYDELLRAQDGKCAICGTTDPGRGVDKFFCIDHDHETELIRGLLCARCNLGIGYLQDDAFIVLRAVRYLIETRVSGPIAGECTLPRGVYDRSKLKKNKTAAAESAAPVVAAAPKGKPGRKPGRKPGSVNKVPAEHALKSSATKETAVSDASVFLFSELRANLTTLHSLSTTFKDMKSINSEIEKHVEALGDLRQKVFGHSTETIIEKAEVEASNGTKTGTAPQYAQSVPLPPTIPNIVPPHS